MELNLNTTYKYAEKGKKICAALTKVVDRAKVHSVAGSHFMAAVLKQIYLDDVSGFEPAFPFRWHSPLASVGPAQVVAHTLKFPF